MKLKTILFGASALLLASCSQDDVKGPENNQGEPLKATYMFSVSLPDDVLTRADEDNTSDLTLYILAYNTGETTPTLEASGNAPFDENGNANVSIDLVTGKQYGVSFVAGNSSSVSNGDNTVFTLDQENGTLTVNYSQMNEQYVYTNPFECYYGYFATDTVTSSTVISTALSLTRPMAQVNWVTNNLSKENITSVYGNDGEYIQSTLTCKPYTTLNLVTGEVENPSTDSSVTFPTLGVPTNDDENLYLGDSTTDVIIAYQYMLAPRQSGEDITLSLTVTNAGNKELTEDEVTSLILDNVVAKIQANYQTNIVGGLLKEPSTSGSTDTDTTEPDTVE